MFIDVVRDEENVVLFAEIADHVDLVALVHLSQRVVGVVKDDGLCFGVEQAGQLFRVQLPIGRGRHALLLCLPSNELSNDASSGNRTLTYRSQRDEPGRAAGEPDHWLVAVKIGLYDDDLVAGVDEAHDGAEERLIRTLSHQNLRQRIDLLPATFQQLAVKLRKRGNEAWMALKIEDL